MNDYIYIGHGNFHIINMIYKYMSIMINYYHIYFNKLLFICAINYFNQNI